MRSRLRFLLPLALLALPTAASAEGACLASEVQVLAKEGNGEQLYRIVFRNRCGDRRHFYWCAENPAAALPDPVACARPGARTTEVPAEPRHLVLHQKEFQWHLPPRTQIRYRDCPLQELPTYGLGCTRPTLKR
jgi:hypothetical protein